MSDWRIDYADADRLTAAIQQFQGNAEKSINDVLHGEGGRLIGERIDALVPVSGRRFKRHSSGAKGSAWQSYDTGENLAVTVAARGKWRYLYFPDDGSNTRKHAGNKQFFPRGAESAAPEVIDLCIESIMKNWEE